MIREKKGYIRMLFHRHEECVDLTSDERWIKYEEVYLHAFERIRGPRWHRLILI